MWHKKTLKLRLKAISLPYFPFFLPLRLPPLQHLTALKLLWLSSASNWPQSWVWPGFCSLLLIGDTQSSYNIPPLYWTACKVNELVRVIWINPSVTAKLRIPVSSQSQKDPVFLQTLRVARIFFLSPSFLFRIYLNFRQSKPKNLFNFVDFILP